MKVETEVVEQTLIIKPKKTGKSSRPDKEPKIYRGSSKRGPCRLCEESGIRRYMIACDLPEPMELCDLHYKEIREELRAALLRILERKGLIPREILDLELGRYHVKLEKETKKHD